MLRAGDGTGGLGVNDAEQVEKADVDGGGDDEEKREPPAGGGGVVPAEEPGVEVRFSGVGDGDSLFERVLRKATPPQNGSRPASAGY